MDFEFDLSEEEIEALERASYERILNAYRYGCFEEEHYNFENGACSCLHFIDGKESSKTERIVWLLKYDRESYSKYMRETFREAFRKGHSIGGA